MHLICVTKYRQKILTSESLTAIENSFKEVAKKMNFEIREFNGESDHIHTLIAFSAPKAISPSGYATRLSKAHA
ncbi:MAG: IS200/IS605 family transposase, partial [Moorea sp. SIO3G5]|nr:IS200/IS605 family transposase [Moorena sp. SIO3G5]